MERLKKIFAVILALVIAVSPLMAISDFSYADNTNDWSDIVNDSQLCAALKAYAMVEYNVTTTFTKAQSQDPITNAIIGWSYNQYRKAAQDANINLATLQTMLKYKVANDGTLQFLYSGSSIQYLNSLIQQYLINNGINVNDNNVDKLVYSGKTFTDLDGNTCFVYIINDDDNTNLHVTWNSYLLYRGTDYLFNGVQAYEDIVKRNNLYDSYNWYNTETIYCHLSNYNNTLSNFGVSLRYDRSSAQNGDIRSTRLNNYYIYNTGNTEQTSSTYNVSGCLMIAYCTTSNKFYLGTFSEGYRNGSDYDKINLITEIISGSSDGLLANIAKDGLKAGITELGKNAAINVGKYGANAIDDYLNDNDPEEPETDNDVPDNGTPNYPSDGGNTTNIGPFNVFGFISPNGTINFQMPDINQFAPNGFSIAGLLQKFPFCIPLDIYSILDLFDAQPVTPRFQGQIDLGIVNYNLDINLSQFDDIMVFFRRGILIMYIFGIIYITPMIVK